MIPILDTHLHLLDREQFDYDWCADLPQLQQNFDIKSYQNLIGGHGVDRCIFMEANVRGNQITEEAAHYSALVESNDTPLIGVIAACLPEKDDFQALLESTLTPAVCGLRRVLHTTPDEISQSSLFRKNIQSLAERNLPFDLCMLERQLPLAYDLVKACPEVQFVLNHCGIPTIDPEHFSTWRNALQQLSDLPNVSCKMSGVIAYFQPNETPLETLRPWLETTVETFGSKRLIFGSDWPVCNLTKDLPAWLSLLQEFFQPYSTAEKHDIFHKNAEHIYFV